MAVAVGAWVGATYTGVDVRDVAKTAITETGVVETLPEEWRPESLRSDPAIDAAQRAEKLAELRSELAELKAETVGRPPSSGDDAIVLASSDEATKTASSGPKEATLAYWNQLSLISTEVARLEAAVSDVQIEAPVRALDLRRRAFSFGRRATALLDRSAVDSAAVELGDRLADFYAGGEDLAERAMAVTSKAGAEKNSPQGPLLADLNRAQQQHQKEVEYLERKIAETERTLTGRFDTKFPPLLQADLDPGQE